MSKEAALAFRDKVSQTPQLQDQVRRAIEAGESFDEAVRLGRKEGFDFTAAEVRDALSEVGSGELSDFELEMVAGGGGKGSPNSPGNNNSNPGSSGGFDRNTEPANVAGAAAIHFPRPKHGW